MDELKQTMKEHIEELLAQGVPQLEIEIELMFFMKKVIYKERYENN